jgi:hypothetical protein
VCTVQCVCIHMRVCVHVHVRVHVSVHLLLISLYKWVDFHEMQYECPAIKGLHSPHCGNCEKNLCVALEIVHTNEI